MRAIWNGMTLAESDSTVVVVEGSHYFPPAGENADAGWYYAQPNPGYEQITNHVAFWRGVEVVP